MANVSEIYFTDKIDKEHAAALNPPSQNPLYAAASGKLFARILPHFSTPYYTASTNNGNKKGKPLKRLLLTYDS